MRHFPIFLDLRGRRVLLVGDGETAERKARPLHAAGAEILRRTGFVPADLAGCALAVGAGAGESDLQALSAAARAAGVPVNIVDRPELCSFIMPAIVDRDPITVAVSSGGAAPVLARLIRARIEAAVPPAFGRLAALADAFKSEIRRRLPDLAARRRVLEALFSGRAADLVFAGRDEAARAEFAAALANHPLRSQAGGIVFLVGGGPGPADLVSLRGQRLLGEADVIFYDDAVGHAVIDLARRDADRILLGAADPGIAQMTQLAAAGKRVVRLYPGDSRDRDDAAALAAAGVAIEIVPGIA